MGDGGRAVPAWSRRGGGSGGSRQGRLQPAPDVNSRFALQVKTFPVRYLLQPKADGDHAPAKQGPGTGASLQAAPGALA